MAIIEFKCDCGNLFSKILQFHELTTNGDPNGPVDESLSRPCTVCGKKSPRITYSVPLQAHFYGRPEGYHKPSPTKRHSYKLASKGGNKDSAG